MGGWGETLTPHFERTAADLSESLELARKFVGWTLDQVDTTSSGLIVERYRHVDGRLGWLAWRGRFGETAVATELKAGHRVLTQLETEQWRAGQMARTARIAARRDRSMPSASAADDCPPYGILRSAVVS